MFPIGRIVGGVVAEMTGSQQLGTLVGAGLDMYLGNTQGAAAQLRTADPGLQNQLFSLFGELGYDFAAGGYGRYSADDYGVSDYVAEQNGFDEMYERALGSDDFVDYAALLDSDDPVAIPDQDLDEVLDEGLALANEDEALFENEDWSDFIDYESDEQAAGDASRGELRA